MKLIIFLLISFPCLAQKPVIDSFERNWIMYYSTDQRGLPVREFWPCDSCLVFGYKATSVKGKYIYFSQRTDRKGNSIGKVHLDNESEYNARLAHWHNIDSSARPDIWIKHKKL